MLSFRFEGGALALIALVALAESSVITYAPFLAARQAANDPYNCDGMSKFFCPKALGTCYTGDNGYIGCCTAESCAPRTTCIPYAELQSASVSCDPDTDGCLACSNLSQPNCVTINNVVEDQFIMYCDSGPNRSSTTSFKNPRKPASTSATTTSTRSSSSAKTTSTSDSTPERTGSGGGHSTPVETEPAESAPGEEKKEGGKGTTFFVAVVLGAILGSALIGGLIWFFLRRRRRCHEPLPSSNRSSQLDKRGSPRSPDLIHYSNAESNVWSGAAKGTDVGSGGRYLDPNTPADAYADGRNIAGEEEDVAGKKSKWPLSFGHAKLRNKTRDSPASSGLSTPMPLSPFVPVHAAAAPPMGAELDGAPKEKEHERAEIDGNATNLSRKYGGENGNAGTVEISRETILAAIAQAESAERERERSRSRSRTRAPAVDARVGTGKEDLAVPTKGHTKTSSGRWLVTVNDNGIPTIGVGIPASTLTSMPSSQLPRSGSQRLGLELPLSNSRPSISSTSIPDLQPKSTFAPVHVPAPLNLSNESRNKEAVNTNADGVSPARGTPADFGNHFVSPEPNTGDFTSATSTPPVPPPTDLLPSSVYNPSTTTSREVSRLTTPQIAAPAGPAGFGSGLDWPRLKKTGLVKGMSATGMGSDYISPEIALRDGLDGRPAGSGYVAYKPRGSGEGARS